MSVYRRLVAVQGSAQLTTALAAMRSADRTLKGVEVENHLIVHDLCAPSEQQAESFADCLFDLGRQAAKWKSVCYMTQADLDRLDDVLVTNQLPAATDALRQKLGFHSCDQLLLGQNVLFINKLLQQAYPSAQRACYGDGIGLNFTSDYYNPRQKVGGLRSVERWLRKKIKVLRGRNKLLSRNRPHLKENVVDFQSYFLLVANGFDQRLNAFQQLNADDFRELFDIFADSLPRYAHETCEQLESALAIADQVVILLTSNFSETNRMSLPSELKCCIDQVCGQRDSENALLIIKPHPRDSKEKIAALQTEAYKHFRSVVTLDDPWTFFVPFESIFARFIASNPRFARSTRVVCSSSVCVSLELLYRQHCELGFGTENVQKHFAVAWQKLRLRHEEDLIRLIAKIRDRLVIEEVGKCHSI